MSSLKTTNKLSKCQRFTNYNIKPQKNSLLITLTKSKICFTLLTIGSCYSEIDDGHLNGSGRKQSSFQKYNDVILLNNEFSLGIEYETVMFLKAFFSV